MNNLSKEEVNYKISEIILNKKGKFIAQDIYNLVEEIIKDLFKSFEDICNYILEKLDSMCNSGLIGRTESYYFSL